MKIKLISITAVALFSSALFCATSNVPFKTMRFESMYYQLRVKKWALSFLNDSGTSGPFELIDPNFIMFFSRCGGVSVVEHKNDQITLLKQFDIPDKQVVYCKDSPAISGLKGSLLDLSEHLVYLSYQKETAPGCLALTVVKYQFDEKTFQITQPSTVFTSQPCRKLSDVVFTQTGGAFAQAPSGDIYFSVGDFGATNEVQSSKTSFGKIFKISRWWRWWSGDRPYVFATGLKNSQGIAWNSEDGMLYITEHGLQGGDEINLASKGDNFGWPKSGYGIEYHHHGLDHYEGDLGHHEFGKKPALTFVPAIAPTGIQFSTSSYFKNWAGDAIVTSLRAMTFFRMRFENKAGIYAEPIANVGERMRSLRIAGNGLIYAKGDANILIELSRITNEDPPDSNFSAFENFCGKCHQSTSPAASMYLPLAHLDQLRAYRRGEVKDIAFYLKNNLMPPPGSGVELSAKAREAMIKGLQGHDGARSRP